MAGRLPRTEDGRIDLHASIRYGVNAWARRSGAVPAEIRADELEDALRMAAHAAAHLVVTRILTAGPGADRKAVAAGALRDALDRFSVPDAQEVPDRLEPSRWWRVGRDGKRPAAQAGSGPDTRTLRRSAVGHLNHG